MSRFRNRSVCNTAVAAALILAVLARVPFSHGLVLHDHGDHGLHSHAVMLDELRDGDLCIEWHRHHDHDHHGDGDPEYGEHAESLFIFVNGPAAATGVHCSTSTVIASSRHLSKVPPRSMLPNDPIDFHRTSAALWPSTPPLRTAGALDALLQSSRALLL